MPATQTRKPITRVTARVPKKTRDRIRLEFERFEIHRPKERWNFYFVVATEHPDKPGTMALTVLPRKPISLRGAADNKHRFEARGRGTEGLTIFERPLPDKGEIIRVRIWLMHARTSTRNAGSVIAEISKFLDKKAAPIATSMGGANPWVAIGIAANQGMGRIGKALAEIKDREMGFLSMDEEIGPEFRNTVEVDRSNKLSTGWATLCWAWSLV